MLGAGAQLPSRLDLAPLADVAANASEVLVIDMIDAVDAELADLPPRRVAAATAGAPAAPRATASTGIAFSGPLTLRAGAESRALWPVTARSTWSTWSRSALSWRAFAAPFGTRSALLVITHDASSS
jgi:hypothetical protein